MTAAGSGGIDAATRGDELLADLLAHPWGQVSPSVYETGRLVTIAPWLQGHEARLTFLTATQRPDGGWGGPDGYALVPTLSATEALLATVRRDLDRSGRPAAARDEIRGAAARGLSALFTLLDPAAATPLPDTPAIEIITPALVALVNEHLDRLADPAGVAGVAAVAAGAAGAGAWPGRRLPSPAGTDGSLLRLLGGALAAGHAVPEKLLHSLEILVDAARDMAGVEPTVVGTGGYSTVGASAASTAAWLVARGLTASEHPARRFLDAVAGDFGGPVPGVYPITAFERGWVCGALHRCGVDVRWPRALLDGLAAALGPGGAPGGAGLPADADTTSMVLATLTSLDGPRDLEPLRPFETDTHFRTWPDERTPSPTVNAHVLDAFGGHPAEGRTAWYVTATEKTSAWLLDAQLPDGSWQDKWHASPYYATARCVLALDRHGGVASTPAVRRAVDWILATQRADGSWGRWAPTMEETAYALQVLLLTRPAAIASIAPAAARAYQYLRDTFDTPSHPPLWHDKDLYLPITIVRANVVGAMHVAQRDPSVAALLANV